MGSGVTLCSFFSSTALESATESGLVSSAAFALAVGCSSVIGFASASDVEGSDEISAVTFITGDAGRFSSSVLVVGSGEGGAVGVADAADIDDAAGSRLVTSSSRESSIMGVCGRSSVSSDFSNASFLSCFPSSFLGSSFGSSFFSPFSGDFSDVFCRHQILQRYKSLFV